MEHIEGLFVDIRYTQKVGYLLELETKVPKDFTIKENVPTTCEIFGYLRKPWFQALVDTASRS